MPLKASIENDDSEDQDEVPVEIMLTEELSIRKKGEKLNYAGLITN